MDEGLRSSNRRRFLTRTGVGGLLGGAGGWRLALGAGLGERRMVVVILRGAMDGLHAVVPLGDPDYSAARGELALPANPTPTAAGASVKPLRRLDDLFWLHGELERFAALYERGEAMVVHAIASRYRERSHFDAQNILETGGLAAYALRDGWLNRALLGLGAPGTSALALSHAIPTVLQGGLGAASYAPSRLPEPTADLFSRVGRLYQGDEALRVLWAQAMGARAMAAASAGVPAGRPVSPLADTAALAARFLQRDDGPRVAVLESDGWDTHAQQAGRLTGLLRQLDACFDAFASGMGQAWSQTVVLAITEFGRTVRPNGTGGTDHGTASAALLAGGALRGGRVLADWPGLAAASLHQGRDLMPTADLRSLLKGLLHEHLGVAVPMLDRSVFPDSSDARPTRDLLRA